MSKTTAVLILVLVIVALAVGAFGARRFYLGKMQQGEQQMLLAKHVEAAGVSADVLALLQRGDEPKARQLLEQYMVNSVRRADELLGLVSWRKPIQPSTALNLRDGMLKVAEYAKTENLGGETAQRAEHIASAISGS